MTNEFLRSGSSERSPASAFIRLVHLSLAIDRPSDPLPARTRGRYLPSHNDRFFDFSGCGSDLNVHCFTLPILAQTVETQ